MLSIGAMGSWSAAYYTQIASGLEDYYIRGREPEGLWFGAGAATLGLDGVVSKEQLENLLAGFSPDKKTSLVRNAGSKDRDLGWDLTFSAPKSVSVFWALSPEPIQKQIERAMRESAQKVLGDYIEKVALFTRRGKAGIERIHGQLVAAMFEHCTSRGLDPNYHIHCLLPNVCVSEDGITRALDSWHLYQHKMAAGALFRAELSHQLQERLGLSVRRVRSWFELDGISNEFLRVFSSRRVDIEKQLYELGENSPKAAALITALSRVAKEQPSRSELFQRWARTGKLHQFEEQQALELLGKRQQPEQTLDDILTESLSKLTYHESSFTEQQLVRAVSEEAQANFLGADTVLKAVKDTLQTSPEIVRLESATLEQRFTTKDLLAVEANAMDVLKRSSELPGIRINNQTVGKTLEDLPGKLTFEQQRAFLHLTQAKGSVRVVSGLAGTGKSYLLKATRTAFENEGKKMIGACLAGKIAEELQQDTGIPVGTIASLAFRIQNNRKPVFDSSTVLVIDEAAMVGTRQMEIILTAAEATGATVLLVGDDKQLQAIEAGGLFTHARRTLGEVELVNITRQQAEVNPETGELSHWKREAVKDAAYGRIRKALRAYAERGMLNVLPTPRHAMHALVSDWKKLGIDNPKDNVILCSTNYEATVLNRLCQEVRLSADALSSNESISVGNEQLYQGDRIMFTRKASKTYGVENGNSAVVTRVDNRLNTIHAKLDKGGTVLIPLQHYGHIRLAYSLNTHRAQGATYDCSFVFLGDQMQNRHMSYVQLSRARHDTRLYTTERIAGKDLKRLTQMMSREQKKQLAHDLIQS